MTSVQQRIDSLTQRLGEIRMERLMLDSEERDLIERIQKLEIEKIR